jgi:hypothetical protein
LVDWGLCEFNSILTEGYRLLGLLSLEVFAGMSEAWRMMLTLHDKGSEMLRFRQIPACGGAFFRSALHLHPTTDCPVHPRLITAMILRTAAACFLGLLAIPAASGHEGQIHTDREAARLMPLPKDDESFHFLIFGDRTGGSAEGMKVLAQAVRDSNMLDPDLVMTVGDLVQGYNEQREWEEQMREFRDTMSGLRMPWFPVAGNHDIYWHGKDRPDTEHETNFETHFGPLWYWFAHKNCGFLVLFSDEGDPADPSKPRIFTDLAQQKFSERQLKWLKGALAAMKDLRHVFVFTHHPRWAADIYPGNNWATVHTLLREAGNVKACFAGHIHRLRYDGEKDGIEYFAMATTGGAMPGNYPGAGYLHHYNLVSVRADGIRVSTLPVGGVIDPKEFTPERLADMNLAAGAKVRERSGRLMLAEDGTGTGVYQVDFTNPSSRPLEVTLTIEAADGWRFVPDHQHAVVEPGATRRFQFDWARPQATPGAPVESPVLVVDSDFLGEKARATLPQRKVPVRVGFGPLSGEVFAPDTPSGG